MNRGYFEADKADRELRERYNMAFADTLIREGYKVYLFGGSLRDMVLGEEWKDADIRAFIPLPPKERDERTEKILAECGIKIISKIIFNENFTIYRFLPENSPAGGVIDFTVVSDNWLVGPDFTINGLYFDLGSKELIDRHDALRDIEARVIRTAKDPVEQFKDEPQMMYRTVKCACQFGFDIEQNTFNALKVHSQLTEGTLGAVADNVFPGMTEWFIGNIFRGLKYDQTKFVKLWNETGLSKTFIHFSAKRLHLTPDQEIIASFELAGNYEESLSMFFSSAARAISISGSESVFEQLLNLYRIQAPSVYGDFAIDQSKIRYVS